ncbi:dihydrolipoyl dehydrogenase [Cuniculiplasma sp. SKW4]|uniref:dihydrolipoyl dehydrogenase n=1 Tax=Cuniculiplasma sp. SKW4 TaxID=3400171 RepID=UPI003FD5DCC8
MKYDAIVIGGGPGGYATAIRLGQRGKSVLLVEKNKIGGECLNYGCIPSKALIEMANDLGYLKSLPGVRISYNIDMSQWQNWKWTMINRLVSGVETLCRVYGVRIIAGEAFIEDKQHVRVGSEVHQCDNLVIATGSSPVQIPTFKDVLYNREILDLKTIPKDLIIIGGGYIGVELGTAFAKLGSQVTLIEMLPNILSGIDPELVKPVERRMKELGVRVMLSAKVASVERRDRYYVRMESGANLSADAVLVTVGRKPNTEGFGLENLKLEMDGQFIKTNNRKMTSETGVYAVGDVSGGPMLAHKAFYEGEVVAENIAGKKATLDYYAMPIVVFSDPEIAYTGEKGEKSTRYPLAANGRSQGLNSSQGFYSIYYNADGTVTGAGIAAPHASEMISELSLSVEAGLNVQDIGATIHPHPTISEGIEESAQIAYDKPLHFKPIS